MNPNDAVVPSMEHEIHALEARTVLALLVDRIVGPESHERKPREKRAARSRVR